MERVNGDGAEDALLAELQRLHEENSRLQARLASVGQGPTTDTLPYASAARWQDQPVPTRQWLLQDWIPMAQTTALYGDGGVGKTLLAQQIATCVAAGRNFFEIPTCAGRVLGIYCEDDEAELHRRQACINDWLGVSYSDLTQFTPVSRVGHDNLLMTFRGDVGELTPFWREIEGRVEKDRPALVQIDTAADTFGGNENVRPQVRQFVQRALTSLATRYNCAVMLLAHPSAAGLQSGAGTGGSTAWNNSVRSRLYIEHERLEGSDVAAPNDVRVLTRKKSNYAAHGESLLLHWQEGVFWQSGSVSQRRDREAIARRVFMECLHEAARRGVNVSANRRGTFAPQEFKNYAQAKREKVGVADLTTAMEDLFAAGMIHADTVRRGSKLVFSESGRS